MAKLRRIRESRLYKKAVASPLTYLTGAVLLGLLNIVHYIVLDSGWSVTGAFFWLTEGISSFSPGPNLQNFGLFIGALISVLACADFKLRKVRSMKQALTAAVGGLLMGYGAGIAGGCNISAFFNAAASLSLSGWVFMIFLFAGVFTGIKLLEKIVK